MKVFGLTYNEIKKKSMERFNYRLNETEESFRKLEYFLNIN